MDRLFTGDQVLASDAKEIKESVRGRDMVARFGGEESAVLIRDTPRSGCKIVAENIRSNIEIKNIQAGVLNISETASLGGAWYRENESIEALIDRAHRSLYSSKGNG
jgi:diguanylate cyclase